MTIGKAGNQDEPLLARFEVLQRQIVELRREIAVTLGRIEYGDAEVAVVVCQAVRSKFGLFIRAVDVVVPVAELTLLPEAPPCVLGTLNHHGTSVVVLDVAQRLDGTPHIVDPSELIVICNARWRQVGLLVTRVLDVLSVDAAEVQEPAVAVEFAPFVLGVVNQTWGPLPVLEVAKLAESCLNRADTP